MTGEFVWSIGKCVHGPTFITFTVITEKKTFCCTINQVYYYNLVVILLNIKYSSTKKNNHSKTFE